MKTFAVCKIVSDTMSDASLAVTDDGVVAAIAVCLVRLSNLYGIEPTEIITRTKKIYDEMVGDGGTNE